MAITFITGLPRAGKTLYALSTVKARAEKESRQVYTCNIPEVTIPGWLEIDHPDKWLDLPNGSILLVDELQDFWQKGATGSKVPLPILELSKHGKRGLDIYIITQEPDLVHATPRLLCQHHYYVVRAFGSQKAMIHKFDRMQLHPEKVKKSSEKIPWSYPTEAFGRVDKATGVVIVPPWYKSADLHNVKRSIPFKVFLIPIGVLVAGLCLWGAVVFGKSVLTKAAGGKAPFSSSAQSLRGAQPPPVAQRPGPLSTADYVASFQPRIEGLAYTAPRYDDQTKPVTVPYPAACIKMAKRCECYTQQATKLPVPESLCLQIVKGGYFNDWAAAVQQATVAPPVAPPDPSQVHPQRAALPVRADIIAKQG